MHTNTYELKVYLNHHVRDFSKILFFLAILFFLEIGMVLAFESTVYGHKHYFRFAIKFLTRSI